jgi:hypothetical protein
MRVDGTDDKKRKIEESLFSMLEKSGVGIEFRPIIFEFLLHLFRVESRDYRNNKSEFIYSTDQTSFDISTGALRASRKRVLRGIWRLSLFMVALIMAASLPRTRRKYANTALLFGFDKEFLNSDIAIENLTKNLRGKFPILFKDVDQILFESRNNAISSFLDSRSRTIPILAFRVLRDNFTVKSSWIMVTAIIKSTFKTIRHNWDIFFIAPDRIFLEFSIWQMMLAKLNFRIVTTQSKLELLPAPFYVQNSNRTMVWYSNNCLPFNKIGHKPIDPEVAVNSGFIDHHYVWSDSHREFLAHRYPNSEITVVGPITFKTSKIDAPHQQEPKGILYFDVIPFDNLEFETFYTSKMCREAIIDLADVAEELGVRLYLKPKRPYLLGQGAKIQHSESYVKLLYKLESQKLVTLLDSRVEIAGAILSSHVVIGLPFTSPVLVSSQLKRPSIYYVPIDAGNWEIPPERDGIAVIQGKNQLLDYLYSLLIE